MTTDSYGSGPYGVMEYGGQVDVVTADFQGPLSIQGKVQRLAAVGRRR